MSATRVLTRPSLVALHLIAVAAITGMVLAGGWQFNIYRSGQQAADAQPLTRPPSALGEVLGPDAAFPAEAVARPVVVHGRYAEGTDEQFLVAGRHQQGQAGYWVVSPLIVSGVSAVGDRPAAILVVRGWTVADAVPPPPVTDVRVTGVLSQGEQGPTIVGPGGVVDTIRIPTLVGEVPFDLYSAILFRTGEDPPPADLLTPIAPPSPEVSWTSGLRNLLYALQWWLFAAFAGFLWWRICAEALGR